MAMVLYPRRIGRVVLRLLSVFLLLGCPQTGSAAGTWSVISLPQQLGEIVQPLALAVDASGSLYIADPSKGSRILKRDAQGNWFVIATAGHAPGQVTDPRALAVDAAGNLYVAEIGDNPAYGMRIQKLDTQGHWSVLATMGEEPNEVFISSGLAVDTSGNLYVSDMAFWALLWGKDRIQKRDAQGN
jgi:tripartite motif-containing protein 71